MPQIIDAGPEIGLVEFPDEMSDEEMSRELEKETYRIEQRAAEKTAGRAQLAEDAINVAEGFVGAPKRIVEEVGGALSRSGKMAAGVAADIGGYIARGEIPMVNRPLQLENTAAAFQGEPLPSDVRDEEIARTHPNESAKTAANIRLGVRGVLRSVPVVAGAVAANRAGVPMPPALAAPMGAQTFAETGDSAEALQSAAIGMAIPPVAGLGRKVAGGVMSRAVKGGLLSSESTVAQKAIETLASQAAVQALIETVNVPQYLQMNPEERKGALIRSVAGNLTFMLADLPHFKAGVPSETQAQLLQDASWMVGEMLNRAELVNADPEAVIRFAQDPENANIFRMVPPSEAPAVAKEGEGPVESLSTASGVPTEPPRVDALDPVTVDSETQARASMLDRAGVWEASTPVGGHRARGIWTVVEARDLLTSADKGFDETLQPRDRSRGASAEQIAEIVRKFEPERLGEAPTTDLGAPIVDEFNQVLSGNGRVTALRQIYGAENKSKADAYRAWMLKQAENMGTPPDVVSAIKNLKEPVLVRQVSDYGLKEDGAPLTKQDLARESNEQQVLGMSEAEKAASDAGMLLRSPELMQSFRPGEDGDVIAASNRDFLKNFISGTGDAAALKSEGATGFNAPALSKRVKNAVLGALMAGENNSVSVEKRALLTSLIERGEDLGLRNVVTGVLTAAPKLVELRGGNYDLGGVVSKALEDVVRLRTDGRKVEDYLGQMEFLPDPNRTSETDFLLREIAAAKSAKAIIEPLLKYAEAAKRADNPTGDMFGAQPKGRAELLREAFAKGKPEQVQPELLAAKAKDGNSSEKPKSSSKVGGRGKSVAEEPVLATVQQATLPRKIESETPTVGSTQQRVSLAGIRQYLSKALDIPVRSRRYGKRALGIFRVKPETIRMRALNDIPTLAHEVGHYLHWILFPKNNVLLKGDVRPDPSDFAGRFDSELLALGKRTSLSGYTKEMVRAEGVAEFVREWMTDRTQALVKAPHFAGHFEAELMGKYPETWEILENARKDLRQYIQQPVAMKVRSRINRKPETIRRSFGEWWDKTVTDWVNELNPVETSLRKLVSFGLPEQHARNVNDLAVNYMGGWRGKVEHSLYERQIDLQGNDVGPSLREVLSGIEDLTEFGDWLVARRELEVRNRGVKTGMDPADAADQAKWVASLGGRYGRKADALYHWQKNNLKLLVDAGVLSADSFSKMLTANEFYVPFYRVMEYLQGSGTKKGEGFINLGQGVFKLKGSDRQYIDPLENIVKNAYLFRDLAERNKVASAFVDAVETVRGGGRVGEGITKKVRPVRVSGEEMARQLEKEIATLEAAGIALPAREDVGDIVDVVRNMTLTVWRAAKQSSPKEGIFTVWKGGEERVFQIGDPDLYRALALADSNDAMIFSKVPFLTMLRGFTRVMRAGATLTAEFMARNPFRDQITAGVYSKYGFVPFVDGFRGMLSALKKDQWYWDWVKSGGRYADFISADRKDLQAVLRDVVPAKDLKAALMMAQPWNVVRNLQRVSELMEQATRIAEFRRSKQGGASDLEAANASKEVTLNFARAGMKGKLVNQLVAFFNAGVQDLSKFSRAHQERPLQTTLKAMMYISTPSILAWWLGRDDEAIQRLPEWRRSFFWNINLRPVLAQMGKDEDFVLSVPKPFLLGQIYGTSFERGLDYVNERDPNAVKKWFHGVLQATPFTVANVIPTAAKPVVENWANRSLFRDAPIETMEMQKLPSELRYTPGTSLVARKLGELAAWPGMNISPVQIDNLTRGWFAGLGKYATDATDFLMTKLQVMDVPEAPAKTIWERPLLKAFKASPYEPGAYVDRFYRAIESAEERVAGFKAMGDALTTDTARKMFKRDEESLLFYSMPAAGGKPMISHLRDAREKMGEIANAMREVQSSRELSPEEKREKLVVLTEIRDGIAEAAFRMFVSPRDQKAFY